MTYDDADKAIRAINRRNLQIFSRLKTKLMKTDELNIIRDVGEAYTESLGYVESQFLDVARLAYGHGMQDCGKRRNGDDIIDIMWLIDFLTATDPVTLYSFLWEEERKKARLTEALSVTPNKGHEVDKALRLWTRQIGWSAISVVDAATIKAFEDAGILKVKWVSKHDDRVCDECWDRNGMVYEIKKVPPKHPACRCTLKIVRE